MDSITNVRDLQQSMDIRNPHLVMGARTSASKRGGVVVLEELKEHALRLYQEDGGTFSTPEAALNFILYDRPGKVAGLIFKEAESVGKPIRYYIENLAAGDVSGQQLNPNSSQCGMASKYNPVDLTFMKKMTICWLCGCPISKDNRANAPECEHIIPALRATMTVGMFSTLSTLKKIQGAGKLADPMWKQWNDQTADNYLWAHSACNQSAGKGSMVLLGFDKKSKLFNFNDQNGVDLQEKIYAIIGRGIITGIPKELQGKQSCYASIIDKAKQKIDRKYGECTTTGRGDDGNIIVTGWDPSQEGCVTVNSPFEVYQWEMQRAASQVNSIWDHFNDDLPAFGEYCLMQTKLYLNAEGLKLALTEKERLEKAQVEAQFQAERDAAYQQKCMDIIEQIKEQIDIIHELHSLAFKHFRSIQPGGEMAIVLMESEDLILQKATIRTQIQAIFTVYCRNSSIVTGSESTDFINHIMGKIFVDTAIITEERGTPYIEEAMMTRILQSSNNQGLLVTYINILVLFDIVNFYGWQNLSMMPDPTWGVDRFAHILYPAPQDPGRHVEAQAQERLRNKFIREHNQLTDSKRGPGSRSKIEDNLDRLFRVGNNFVLPHFPSEEDAWTYLTDQVAVLIGMISQDMSDLETTLQPMPFALSFSPGLQELEKQKDLVGKSTDAALREQIGNILAAESTDRIHQVMDTNMVEIITYIIDNSEIMLVLQKQVPIITNIFSNKFLRKRMADMLGCNITQRMLYIASHQSSPSMIFQAASKLLQDANQYYCMKMGFDKAAIEARGHGETRSAEEAKEAMKEAMEVEEDRTAGVVYKLPKAPFGAQKAGKRKHTRNKRHYKKKILKRRGPKTRRKKMRKSRTMRKKRN